MIDNLNVIKPILNFQEQGDFYMLLILKRKKDQPEDEKVQLQSVRTIKTYCVDSIEYLEKRYDEIKTLCEVFNARAYIHVQKQNHRDVAMNMITEIVTRIQSGKPNQKNVFDSVVGKIKTIEKRWIVDVDTKDDVELKNIMSYIDNECRPEGSKIETIVPTKNGVHLITSRFDVMKFGEKYPHLEVKKKNPTLLYLPKNLN